jgi:hypothetical protein
VWSYSAPKKADFFSSFISGAQRLSNGNTLICSGANGTIFEVTPEKAVVWKYINPVKSSGRNGSPPQPGRIMPPVAGEMLALSADQRKQLDEIQKDIDAHLDKLFTADQVKQSKEWPRDSGGGPVFEPPQRPGQVMSAREENRLKLTEPQKKDVLALQKAVEGRFDGVLTAAQKHQLKTVFAPFGPPPGGPGPGDPTQPGKIFSPAQQDTLKLSVGQRKRLAEIQKELDAKLETLLTEDQRNQLATMRDRPGGGGPGRAGPPGGQPIFRALRYATSFPGFAGRDLKPGKTLEELQPKEPEKKAAEKRG